MNQYLYLLQDILKYGTWKDTRGQRTKYLFGQDLTFDLSEGFPLVTTRALSFKSVAVEALWLTSGAWTIQPMLSEGVSFWKPWADDDGQVESYGGFWRHVPSSPGWQLKPRGKSFVQTDSEFQVWDEKMGFGIDQLALLLHGMETNPYSRRHKLDYWIPQNALASDLPNCPLGYVFDIDEYTVNAHLTQRSMDVPVGGVQNIAVSAFLMHLIADELEYRTGYEHEPGRLKISITNAHIYEDQIPVVEEQTRRDPKELPELQGRLEKPLLEAECSDWNQFELCGYDPHSPLDYPVQN